MKRLLLIIILTLSFQTLAKTDDIRDFEIEGMSIEDSALEYFTKKELNNKEDLIFYKSKNKLFKFQTYSYRNYQIPKKFLNYENVEMHFKKNDNEYIIKSLGGLLYFRNDLKNCLKKKDKIVSELSNTFKNSNKIIVGLESWLDKDPSGDTKTAHVYFDFKDGAYIEVACYDWSDKITKEFGYQDHLKVSLRSNDYDSLFNYK
jgi:hypothetical protein